MNRKSYAISNGVTSNDREWPLAQVLGHGSFQRWISQNGVFYIVQLQILNLLCLLTTRGPLAVVEPLVQYAAIGGATALCYISQKKEIVVQFNAMLVSW